MPPKKRAAKKPRIPRKRGRPSTYSKAIADKILDRLADGEGLVAICKPATMPSEALVRRWAYQDVDGFAAKYAHARDVGVDVQADRLFDLAETALGKNAADVQAIRLMVDTRKWYLSKIAPKRYGDRLQMEVGGEIGVRDLSDEQLQNGLSALLTKVMAGSHKKVDAA